MIVPASITEEQIREALIASLKQVAYPGSRIVEEMGVGEWASARVDVALITRTAMYGYEIKSDADTLRRLPKQVAAFSRVFDHMVIVGNKWLEPARPKVPDWWALNLITHSGVPNGYTLIPYKNGGRNPSPDPVDLLKLLWRDEAYAALRARGAVKIRGHTKGQLQEALLKCLTVDEVGALVRSVLLKRDWSVGWVGPGLRRVIDIEGEVQ